MSITVDFLFDFSAPNAYLAHKVIPGIAERTGCTFTYIPVLLGGIFKATGNQAPMIRDAAIPAKQAYDMLEFRRFIATHKLPFKMNPTFPMNTVMAIRGALVAETMGVLKPYIEAVSIAMWEEEKKLDEADVLISVIDDTGLDGKAIVEGTADPAIKQKLIDNTEMAVKRGAFGLPTFFVEGEIYFGKERLDQLEAAIIAAG